MKVARGVQSRRRTCCSPAPAAAGKKKTATALLQTFFRHQYSENRPDGNFIFETTAHVDTWRRCRCGAWRQEKANRKKKLSPLRRLPVVVGKVRSSLPTARGNIEGNGARGRPSRRKKEQLYRHQAVLDIQRLTTSILNMLQTLFRQPSQHKSFNA